MINAIAIDDEPLALEVIRSLAARVPFLKLTACFTDAFKAMEYLAANPTDLIFMDIKMPDISGIELMESLPSRPQVIFTTAYAEHAVKSYELNATDYLLKPFAYSRFLAACHKVNEQLQSRKNNTTLSPGSMFVKSGYETVKVIFDELLYLESDANYITFVLANGTKVVSRLTITEALGMLPPNDFSRVHRSFIVNRSKIDRIERHRLQVSGHYIPVGTAFIDVLR